MILFHLRGGYFFHQSPHSLEISLISDYAIRGVRIPDRASSRYEFRISFSQGLKYRRFEAFPLIEWNGTPCARKENVNQALGLGKNGQSPFAPSGGTRNYGGTGRWSRSTPGRVCVCVCLLYASSTVCERRSVDANATLVGGWLFRRPVIYRLSCAQNALSLSLIPPSLSLLHPRVYFRAGKLDVFSSPGGRVSAPESSILFFALFAFLYTSLCWKQALGGAGPTSLLY